MVAALTKMVFKVNTVLLYRAGVKTCFLNRSRIQGKGGIPLQNILSRVLKKNKVWFLILSQFHRLAFHFSKRTFLEIELDSAVFQPD